MQYKNTLEAINIQMNELLKLVSNVGLEGTIHTIDVDLALEKIREVYDLLYNLKTETHTTLLISEAPSSTSEIKNTENSTIKNPVESHIEDKTSGDEPFELSSAVETSLEKEKTVVFEESEPKSSQSMPELTQAQKISRVGESENKFLGETFHAENKTINEELSQKVSSTDLSARLKTKPITSLSRAVGINEKFEFIQVLFGGDKSKYDKTLDILDGAQDFNEAYDYISKNYSWDMNNEYVQRLLELIRRKFIVRKND